MEFPLLSVCLITYNHKRYIREAIDSVLMQKVNFEWELIIADDYSTDGTREIVIEYKERYPDFIKLILQDKNVGPAQNWMDLINSPKSKYIAYFEGDDYWTDSFKIKKQIDFLEANPDFSICSTNAIVKNEIFNTQTEWFGANYKEVLSLKDLLRYGSGGASSTLVFKQSIVSTFPDWFIKIGGGDWLLQIVATEHGKMYSYREVTTVYRRNEGSISCTNDLIKTINIYEVFGLQRIELLKNSFNHKYDNLLNAQFAEYWHFNLMQLYLKNKDNKKARDSAFIVLKNLYRIRNPFSKFKDALKTIIQTYK